MNREKKQYVVIGVLALLIVGVGAFQFTRSDPPPPPAAKKDTAKVKPENEVAAVTPLLYPELGPLQSKDPFEISAFVTGSVPQQPTPTTQGTTPGGSRLSEAGKRAVKDIDYGGPTLPWQAAGITGDKGKEEVVPVTPPKPVFGYTLVGLIDGDHPMAVFDDGKGNQQLVEAGQSVGSSATVTKISGGKVRVRFNAETLVFNVGGNTNAK